MLVKFVDSNGNKQFINIRNDTAVTLDLQVNCSGHCSDCGVVQECAKIDNLVYGPKEEVNCDGYCVICPAVRDCMKIKRSISTGYQWPDEKKEV